MDPEIEQILDEIDLPTKYKSRVQHVIFLIRPLLHYLPRGIPRYTDHGVLHSQNLMRLLSNFLSNWTSTPFSDEEKYLLCLSVWLHDIGCLLGRKKHNEKSVKLLEHQRFSFIDGLLDGALQSCLKYIIVSHSTDYDLERIPKDPIDPNVRLRLTCATFRLIDGCDITDARTKPILYDILTSYSLLGKENFENWRCHLSTIGAVFKGSNIYITYRRGKRRQAETLLRHLKTDLKSLNGIFGKYGLTFRTRLRWSEY